MTRAVAALLLALCLCPPAWAQDAAVDQVAVRIKAAFLYHFCNYVEWPEQAFAGADSPLVIGVAGPPVIAQTISAAVRERSAHNRPLQVRLVEDQADLDGVHLLYIDANATAATRRLASMVDDRAVLVVTDIPGGLEGGSAINFVIENDKVRFDVALDAARERELRVSAQLLTVARHVEGVQ